MRAVAAEAFGGREWWGECVPAAGFIGVAEGRGGEGGCRNTVPDGSRSTMYHARKALDMSVRRREGKTNAFGGGRDM